MKWDGAGGVLRPWKIEVSDIRCPQALGHHGVAHCQCCRLERFWEGRPSTLLNNRFKSPT